MTRSSRISLFCRRVSGYIATSRHVAYAPVNRKNPDIAQFLTERSNCFFGIKGDKE